MIKCVRKKAIKQKEKNIEMSEQTKDCFRKGQKDRNDGTTRIDGAGDRSEERKKRSSDSLHGEFVLRGLCECNIITLSLLHIVKPEPVYRCTTCQILYDRIPLLNH